MSANNAYLVFFLGTFILLMFAFSLIVFLIHYKRKQQVHLTEKTNLQHQLLQTRLEVQEQAFQYFSEEIHDNVGQQLTLCKLQMHRLNELSATDETNRLIAETTGLLSNALSDLRNISHTLNGNFISKRGLQNALEQELKYIASAKKIKTTLDIDGEIFSLGNEKELLIFRIIQEAITNALKHSSPTAIKIFLQNAAQGLLVKIMDDGKGFDVTRQSGGLGLHNMQLRAALLGGDIAIDSSEHGTIVTLKIKAHE